MCVRYCELITRILNVTLPIATGSINTPLESNVFPETSKVAGAKPIPKGWYIEKMQDLSLICIAPILSKALKNVPNYLGIWKLRTLFPYSPASIRAMVLTWSWNTLLTL